MEIRKVNFERDCKAGVFYEIPTNWYIPARRMCETVAWFLIQLRKGNVVRNEKDMNKIMEQFEEYVEEYAFAYGKENGNGTEKS